MKSIILSLALVLILPFSVNGADVQVVKPGAAKSAIDLSGFKESRESTAATFRKTLEDDLKRSGWFEIAGQGQGVIAVSGSCEESRGRLRVKCDVKNTATAEKYFSRTFREESGNARRLAHVVADEIVRAVKQRRGIASTRIAMIGSRGGHKDVYICDADGRNFTRVTKTGTLCISPNWGPNADNLVYTSFHGGFPDVYMIDLVTNTRRRIAGYPGLNAGADVSPDGKSVALTLSKDGNPDLYILNLRKGGRLARLTRTRYAAEASPSWSPDGKQVVFVSDKSGSPQLYIIEWTGKGQRRITFRGNESVAPDWGPDGRIVFSSRRGGRYHICVITPETRRGEQLTSGSVDHEEPSWAPDGRHIVYTHTEGYRSDLYVLDSLGDLPVRLTAVEGNWYSPAWSPK